MMETTPKNAQEALQTANRFDRAHQIIAEGYTFTQDRELPVVFVCKPGRLYAEYTIGEQLTGRGGCSCPDFQKTGNRCKHMMAWEIIQAEKASEEAHWEAVCTQWEDENFFDMIPTPTLESIAAKDLYQKMSADLKRVEMAIHTHCPRNVNPIQCQQDRNKAARLQCAVHVVAEYR